MTRFNIEQLTEQPDRLFVEIDCRFNIAIIRFETSLEIRVYPRTDGELWDAPFRTFTVDEDEVAVMEANLTKSSDGEGQ